MNNRTLFKQALCRELGIPYIDAIGETDDIIVLSIKDNDVATKSKIKNWMSLHHWVLAGIDEKDIQIHPLLKDVIHQKMVTYSHNNHKIIISCE